MDSVGVIITIVVIQAIAFGFFTQIIATAKGHEQTTFFWLGFFFSFAGLIFAVGLPAKVPGSGNSQSRQPRPPAPALPPSGLYLHLNDKVQGPFTMEQIEGFLQVGTATPDTPCCVEGDEQWRPLGSYLS